jgi:hypothetical protein
VCSRKELSREERSVMEKSGEDDWSGLGWTEVERCEVEWRGVKNSVAE